MELLQKLYDFKGKIAGSEVENPHKAFIDKTEFTQDQYDKIYASSLHLEIDVIPMNFEFKVDIDPNKIHSVSIYTTSKSTSEEIRILSGDFALYNRKTEYTQKQLQMLPGDLESLSEKLIKFSVEAPMDIDIYGVKVEVNYDDDALNRFSGLITYEENGNSINKRIENMTYDDLLELLSTMHDMNIQNVMFARIPTEGIIFE